MREVDLPRRSASEVGGDEGVAVRDGEASELRRRVARVLDRRVGECRAAAEVELGECGRPDPRERSAAHSGSVRLVRPGERAQQAVIASSAMASHPDARSERSRASLSLSLSGR